MFQYLEYNFTKGNKIMQKMQPFSTPFNGLFFSR